MGERERLAALATAHGYERATLALLCEATFPAHSTGERLTDDQLAALAEAIDVLATAGLAPRELAATIEHHRSRHGPRWRQRFWGRWCRLATHQHHHQSSAASAPAAAVQHPPARRA